MAQPAGFTPPAFEADKPVTWGDLAAHLERLTPPPPAPAPAPVAIPASIADRPVTWRDLAVCAHGALTAWALHPQAGWLAAGLVGATTPAVWALVRGR
ncbi:hypothetical protein [Kitasatospora sp. NA04385]|uniref:hypothetical protein n=1 Tax=Kitasatospora sp. NA04385 TaxID=2742135 RepID=UPI001C37DA3C|nr:hypothetical protein [Kitasatospora sp. NA04385]